MFLYSSTTLVYTLVYNTSSCFIILYSNSTRSCSRPDHLSLSA